MGRGIPGEAIVVERGGDRNRGCGSSQLKDRLRGLGRSGHHPNLRMDGVRHPDAGWVCHWVPARPRSSERLDDFGSPRSRAASLQAVLMARGLSVPGSAGSQTAPRCRVAAGLRIDSPSTAATPGSPGSLADALADVHRSEGKEFEASSDGRRPSPQSPMATDLQNAAGHSLMTCRFAAPGRNFRVNSPRSM